MRTTDFGTTIDPFHVTGKTVRSRFCACRSTTAILGFGADRNCLATNLRGMNSPAFACNRFAIGNPSIPCDVSLPCRKNPSRGSYLLFGSLTDTDSTLSDIHGFPPSHASCLPNGDIRIPFALCGRRYCRVGNRHSSRDSIRHKNMIGGTNSRSSTNGGSSSRGNTSARTRDYTSPNTRDPRRKDRNTIRCPSRMTSARDSRNENPCSSEDASHSLRNTLHISHRHDNPGSHPPARLRAHSMPCSHNDPPRWPTVCSIRKE